MRDAVGDGRLLRESNHTDMKSWIFKPRVLHTYIKHRSIL